MAPVGDFSRTSEQKGCEDLPASDEEEPANDRNHRCYFAFRSTSAIRSAIVVPRAFASCCTTRMEGIR